MNRLSLGNNGGVIAGWGGRAVSGRETDEFGGGEQIVAEAASAVAAPVDIREIAEDAGAIVWGIEGEEVKEGRRRVKKKHTMRADVVNESGGHAVHAVTHETGGGLGKS
jgi:predicted esterase YcpF (UPF0227 family)